MPKESLWDLVSRTMSTAGSIEKFVFVLLIAFSVASWAIIFMKLCTLYVTHRNSARFLTLFGSADSLGAVLTAEHSVGPSPLMAVFKAALRTLETRPLASNTGNGRRTGGDPRQISLRPESAPAEMAVLGMQQVEQAEFTHLQFGLGFLATIGSTSPFIGLFGTVWGIMNTFRALDVNKSASLAVVGPGLSSALIATAAGLAVAIPAVMAYNWFVARIGNLQDQADGFVERMDVLIRAGGIPSGQAAPQFANAGAAAAPPPQVSQPPGNARPSGESGTQP
ncbi:MAG: MotA/TolQ/ExbB proton channel family protein [Planctomycetota bacterium]